MNEEQKIIHFEDVKSKEMLTDKLTYKPYENVVYELFMDVLESDKLLDDLSHEEYLKRQYEIHSELKMLSQTSLLKNTKATLNYLDSKNLYLYGITQDALKLLRNDLKETDYLTILDRYDDSPNAKQLLSFIKLIYALVRESNNDSASRVIVHLLNGQLDVIDTYYKEGRPVVDIHGQTHRTKSFKLFKTLSPINTKDKLQNIFNKAITQSITELDLIHLKNILKQKEDIETLYTLLFKTGFILKTPNNQQDVRIIFNGNRI